MNKQDLDIIDFIKQKQPIPLSNIASFCNKHAVGYWSSIYQRGLAKQARDEKVVLTELGETMWANANGTKRDTGRKYVDATL